MTAPNGNVCPRKFWFAFLAVLLLAGMAIVLVEPFQAVKGNTAVVTYTHGLLNVTIPYHSAHSGDGKLTVEVLDPEDKVLGRAETQVAITKGDGCWQQKIRLDKSLAVEDLVCHRVRYRYAYEGHELTALEGTESISQILRTPVVHILGRQSYLSGALAAVGKTGDDVRPR